MEIQKFEGDKERNKLLDTFGESLCLQLKACKAVLAGGAVTSLFCNREVADYDIYLPDKVAVSWLLEGIEDFNVLWVTRKAILLQESGGGIMLQLIFYKDRNNIKDILESFDFTVCMGAYNFETDEWWGHPEFLKHNSQRRLIFNEATDFPIISVIRVKKYEEKGYKIPKPELVKMLLTVMKLDINSWEELEDHIGGLYGYTFNEVFDKDKEFSLKEAFSQLSTLEVANKIDNPVTKFNYVHATDLVKKFNEDLYKEAEKQAEKNKTFLEKFYQPHCFYKTVSKDLKSIYAGSNKITYKLYTEVNGGKEGIFVDANPLKPYLCNRELPRIELSKIASSEEVENYGYDKMQKVLLGTWLVTRVIEPKEIPTIDVERLYEDLLEERFKSYQSTWQELENKRIAEMPEDDQIERAIPF